LSNGGLSSLSVSPRRFQLLALFLFSLLAISFEMRLVRS
jgi:hypothetical protein